MSALQTLAYTGAALMGGLACLFLVAWRSVHAKWPISMAVAYLSLAWHYATVGLHASATPDTVAAPSAFAVPVAYMCISVAILDYARLATTWKKLILVLIGIVASVATVSSLLGLFGQRHAITVQAAVLVVWAVLFLYAERREPRRGHSFNAALMVMFATLCLASLADWLPEAIGRVFGIVPHALLAATLLTTGLARAIAAQREEMALRQQSLEELARLNIELEARVAQRTRALREQVDALEVFNRSVSHDLRGPLGGMAALARAAARALERGELAFVRQALDETAGGAERAHRLVQSLLELARADAKAIRLAPVSLPAIVQEAAETVRKHQERPFDIRIDAQLPVVRADADLIRQVYVNLIGNAVKFGVSDRRPVVEAGVTSEGVLFVSDEGVGFDPMHADRIFKPFEQLHSGFAGTGVGLSIVKRIVDRHGGEVRAESQPGRGTTVLFTMGRADEPPAECTAG